MIPDLHDASYKPEGLNEYESKIFDANWEALSAALAAWYAERKTREVEKECGIVKTPTDYEIKIDNQFQKERMYRLEDYFIKNLLLNKKLQENQVKTRTLGKINNEPKKYYTFINKKCKNLFDLSKD